MSESALRIWEYRDMAAPPPPSPLAVEPTQVSAPAGFSEEQMQQRVQGALAEAEQRWRAEAEAHEKTRTAQMQGTLEQFARERARYFRDTEQEVVHLALAIARKVLQREAVLDPDLLGALVRMALDRMAAGPAVRLRVPPAEAARWHGHRVFQGSDYRCEVIPDASVAPGDCRVETDLGSASFGLEGQMKEIERGVLDLLEARPRLPDTPATAEQAAGRQR